MSKVINAVDTSGLVWVTLWTNPDPTINFAAQEVQISNINSYSHVRILYKTHKSSADWLALAREISEAYIDIECFNAVKYHRRTISIGNGKAVIDGAYTYGSYGNAGATSDNQYLIPIRIEARMREA